MFPIDVQPYPAGHQQLHARGCLHYCCYYTSRAQHLLEVVQHQEQLLLMEIIP